MNVEREAKLVAPDDFVMPDLSGVKPGIVAAAAPPRQLDAVYYDTEDLHLARAGVTLRHRTGESGPPWTLKLPHADGAPATLTRGELFFDGSPGQVPAAAADLVQVYVRARALGPVVRLRTTRTAIEVCDPNGASVAEVVDDSVEVYEGRRLARRFREIEVELRDHRSGGKLLRATVARLVDAGCRADPPLPKAIRALGPRAQTAPEAVVGDVDVDADVDADADATMGQLARHALARSVAQIVRHDPGVRLGEDPEDVHQFRVGARRLRSDLRTFAALFAPDWVVHLRDELAWLGAEIGTVRDADVLTDRLRSLAATLPEPDTAPVGVLLQHLADQRDRQRAALLVTLRSPRYDTLVDMLVQAAGDPPLNGDLADRLARETMAGLVRGRWRHLVRAVEDLGGDPADDALHKVRILAKRCRYAAEAATPVVGPRAARFVAAIADVQAVLGDHQDAVVAEAWLRGAAAPDTSIAVGELIAVQRLERARLREAWPAVWKAASAPKLHKWL